jgi:hypothetical protein
MKLFAGAAILAAVLAGPLAQGAMAQSQIPQNPKVKVDYLEPRAPSADDSKAMATYKHHQAIYDRMTQRGVLEELSRFLSPLKLPVGLRIKTLECNTINAFYDPQEWTLKLCYEYFASLEKEAPQTVDENGFTRQQSIVGGFLAVTLHELGHAVSDIFNLPVMGREEDSADQIAAFVSMQFGPEVARTAINGAAHSWLSLHNRRGDVYPFWDAHSTDMQRVYNFLCIGYGGQPELFKDMVEKRWLPKVRADNCGHEYERLRLAFRQTLLPHIDQDLMKRVQAEKWLRPEDGKW